MKNKEYQLNDHVVMKKQHACGNNEWIITRMGVDIKLKCAACGREIMMERFEFEKKLKNVLGEKNDEKK
ncbi:MAG: DUF951 domain-containing protein [Bacilli bacterium]|nr:DUF951 domain-containing protein [Bacilli bacterium]